MFPKIGRRYKIVRKLGAGGMGVVYEAVDRETGMRVALKALVNVAGTSLLRFKREFRGLAEIEHPNLVRLHELVEEDGVWFFTMELIDGQDLISYVCGSQALVVSTEPQTRAVATEEEAASDAVAGPLRDGRLPVQSGPESVTAEVLIDQSAVPYDRERLVSCLKQLGRALMVLHGKGKVHRDIKPGNILVTKDGRLVLLDFGLVIGIDRDDEDRLTGVGLAGTVAYMAPEVAAEVVVGPAADWYSVGVILYQVLTSRLPFEGAAMQVLLAKQNQVPESPRLVNSHCDGELADLAMALLDPDPDRRPTGVKVLARLGDAASVYSNLVGSSGSTDAGELFVGREREMGRLREIWRETLGGRCAVVLLTGSSGIGKSALIDHFRRHVVETTTGASYVFSGRCHERETVPFKAFDAVVDQMTSALLREEAAGRVVDLPGDVELLVAMFPVLGRVRALTRVLNRQALAGRDPQESRRRAFWAFGDLLEALSTVQPVVVFIDDVQWIDGDSIDLFEGLVSRFQDGECRRHRVLFLLARRKAMAGKPNGEWIDRMRRRGDLTDVELGPLPDHDARLLARILTGRAGLQDQDLPDRIAAESIGNPFFVGEVVRFLQYQAVTSGEQSLGSHWSLEGVILDRLSHLTDKGMRLLDTLAVAGQAVPHAVVAAAADVPMSDPDWWREVSALRGQRLVRCHGFKGRDLVETYHDRIRQSVIGRMDEERLRRIHANLARAMEGARHVTVDVLARHWLAAGESGRAKDYVLRIAKQAMEKLAFERAAELYEQAIGLENDPATVVELQRELGDALASSGQVARAAEAFVSAARQATDVAVRLDARYKAADQMLKGGYVERGLEEIRIVLSEIGYSMPKSGKMALLATAFQRARLKVRGLSYQPRDRSEISPKDRTVLDVLWSVAVGLSIVEPILSALFHAQLTRLALDVGDEAMLSGCFAMEASLLATVGVKTMPQARRLGTRATSLARKTGDDRMLGRSFVARAILGYFSGDWRSGVKWGNKASQHLLDRCHGVGWELATTYTFVGFSLMMLGDMNELGRHVWSHLEEARRAGDRFLAANLQTSLGIAWLAADRTDEVEENLSRVLDSWPTDRYQMQHFYRFYSRVELFLYQRRAKEAWDLVDREVPLASKAFLSRVSTVQIELLRLRARAALALVPMVDTRRERTMLRRVANVSKRLRRLRLSFGEAWADHLDAAVLWHETRDRERTEEALTHAIGSLESCELGLHALCARRRLAELNEDEGALAEVDERMRRLGVVRPDRIVEVLSPGLAFS